MTLDWNAAIKRALGAHERQPRGRVVSILAPSANLQHLCVGDVLLATQGPDRGRTCAFVRWEIRGQSVRVRFPEREAVVPREWLEATQ